MKSIPTPHTLTTFFLPADDLRAAFQCVSTEARRYYLNGVFCTRQELVALDGVQMLQVQLPETVHIGAECETQDGGFLLQADHTDKAWKARTADELWVHGDVTTGLLQFVSKPASYKPGEPCQRVGVMEFARIDGTFPDYKRVVANGGAGSGVLTYNPVVLARLQKGADVLHKGAVIRLTSGGSEGDPILVQWSGLHHLRGTLMPCRSGHWVG